jgi:Xaa-Pro aminopeptidase
MLACARRSLSTAAAVSAAFGQPHWQTHPHIVPRVGELTPGLLRGEFAARRAALGNVLPANAMALVAGYSERTMSNDIPYEFRHGTSLLYFTGFLEPDSLLVVESDAERRIRATLVVPPRDPSHELWDGPRTGAERAAEFTGVDAAVALPDAAAVVRDAAVRAKSIVIDSPEPVSWHINQVFNDAFRGHDELRRKVSTSTLPTLVQMMRVRKSPAEIAVLQRSADIAAAAFADVLSTARAGELERAVAASLDYHCRRRGASRLAFPPVVAGGRNALTLHYVANTALLRDGDLVLLDGGCEFGGYVSDISRTFPVAARFTPGQREVYERVLDVNERCIALCDLSAHGQQPLTIASLQAQAARWLTEHLLDMGVLRRPTHVRSFERFYPHNIGHWLGMDTHDTPLVPNTTPLAESMCITIEPGLYLGDEPDIPPQYRNIGVRIEDDIVLRNGPATVLTNKLVKSVQGIEALRAKAMNGVM